MALSLKDITAREEGLRREIVEREHLLIAYGRMRAEIFGEPDADWPPAGSPAADGALAPAPNPALTSISSGHGGPRRAVAWAIAQMTEDYDLHDLAALLAREGCPLKTAKISVVLSRMKESGKILELTPGSGRRGAVFERPADQDPSPAVPAGRR